jgi:very-short-patch-repair endonuclease
VVETDGLRYHRTPAQQVRDRLRDQAHTAAGMTPLRFTHAQVRFEARCVGETLLALVRRLEGAPGGSDFDDPRRPDASKLAG